EAYALAPYGDSWALLPYTAGVGWGQHLWHYRTSLESVVSFGGKTRKALGDNWWGWYRWIPSKYQAPLSVVFASVATHNQFAFDRGGKVFNRHAPVIKLPATATENDHLALLGLLNSSTACFWMKQICHNKGSTVDQAGARQRTTPFEDFWEYDGTKLKQFPVPAPRPIKLARELDALARDLTKQTPACILADWDGTASLASLLDAARTTSLKLRGRMIASQEDLDWQCYRLYGLTDED